MDWLRCFWKKSFVKTPNIPNNGLKMVFSKVDNLVSSRKLQIISLVVSILSKSVNKKLKMKLPLKESRLIKASSYQHETSYY